MQQRRWVTIGGWLVVVSVVLAACTATTPDTGPNTGPDAGPDAAPAGSTTAAAGSPGADTTVDPPVATGEADRVLSGDVAMPDGFEVPPGETWVFDPAVATTVEAGANVIVHGTLVMRPSRGDVSHTLRFVGVDESGFTGGGMDPVASDVGLWVIGDGVLDIAGEEKPAWDTVWHDEWVGDEVVAAPNEPGDYTTFTAVDGADGVPPPNALGYATELMNLTRNVRIEGTPDGKTHIFIRSTRPSSIRYAAIRYVGPDLSDASIRDRGQDQSGRYGLHFHHNEDGSRGTIVEGVVIRDADNHAFVPHWSDGITFTDTIAFTTKEAAYWWDPTTNLSPGNSTDDVVWDHVIAAGVIAGDARGTAFQLGEGENMSVTDSVAVGVISTGPQDSGFHWPGTEDGVWEFVGNTAHNNDAAGILVWQNSTRTHVVEGFTGYYNSKPGVSHGAYRNSYVYRDLTLYENDLRRGGGVAIESAAVGRPSSDGGTDMQVWDGVTTGGAVLRTAGHAQDPEAPVRFLDCDFSEVIIAEGDGHPSIYEFVDCGITPGMVTIDFMHPASVVRSQNGDEAWELTSDGTVTEIAPFVAR